MGRCTGIFQISTKALSIVPQTGIFSLVKYSACEIFAQSNFRRQTQRQKLVQVEKLYLYSIAQSRIAHMHVIQTWYKIFCVLNFRWERLLTKIFPIYGMQLVIMNILESEGHQHQSWNKIASSLRSSYVFICCSCTPEPPISVHVESS